MSFITFLCFCGKPCEAVTHALGVASVHRWTTVAMAIFFSLFWYKVLSVWYNTGILATMCNSWQRCISVQHPGKACSCNPSAPGYDFSIQLCQLGAFSETVGSEINIDSLLESTPNHVHGLAYGWMQWFCPYCSTWRGNDDTVLDIVIANFWNKVFIGLVDRWQILYYAYKGLILQLRWNFAAS